MPHPSARKGASFELECAKAISLELGVDCRRALGAGRAEDTGDLWWPDQQWTIQAKNYANLADGLREAIAGANRQQRNSGTPYAAGMIRRPGGRIVVVQSLEQWATVVRELL